MTGLISYDSKNCKLIFNVATPILVGTSQEQSRSESSGSSSPRQRHDMSCAIKASEALLKKPSNYTDLVQIILIPLGFIKSGPITQKKSVNKGLRMNAKLCFVTEVNSPMKRGDAD